METSKRFFTKCETNRSMGYYNSPMASFTKKDRMATLDSALDYNSGDYNTRNTNLRSEPDAMKIEEEEFGY
jgi:hypothetical protein